MSILRACIRYCAVGALRDRTWCEERVFNSDMTPLAEAVMGQAAKPYAVVYTDVDNLQPVEGKAELYTPMNRRIELVVEIGVASAIREPSKPGMPETGPVVIKFAATDEGMELACDAIDAQVMNALFGDVYSVWGDLFKRLVYKVHRAPRRRGGQSAAGIKYAARRITLVCEPSCYDAVPGMPLDAKHPIRDFITLCRVSPAIGQVDVATIIEDLLTTSERPDWRIGQAILGLDTDGAREAVLPEGTPLPWPGHEEPPLEWDPNEFVPVLKKLTTEEDDELYDVKPND